jgi:hypothetical protein
MFFTGEAKTQKFISISAVLEFYQTLQPFRGWPEIGCEGKGKNVKVTII